MNSSDPSIFPHPTRTLGTIPPYTLSPRPSLLPWITDFHLSLLLPIAAYWILSETYHVISIYNLFSRYRLHTPAEFKTRNRPTYGQVLRSVIVQQIIQTGWGLILGHSCLGIGEFVGREDYDIELWTVCIRRIAHGVQLMIEGASLVIGVNASELFGSFHGSLLTHKLDDNLAAEWGVLAGRGMYFVVYPAFQFAIAIFLSDTWQYFGHRAMHSNKWLFRNMHAQHHRIYVPYAFGAFYNTLSEAFILDTIGTTLSLYIAGLSTRQATLFATMSVLKGVDDHCGYKLPWDPLQWLGEQTVEFHDVHHQGWGIGTNYSQLYLTFWDHVCGTVCRKTEAEKELLYQRGQFEAEKRDKKDI